MFLLVFSLIRFWILLRNAKRQVLFLKLQTGIKINLAYYSMSSVFPYCIQYITKIVAWRVYQHLMYWLHCIFCYCRTWSNLECKSLVCSTVNWKAFTNSIVNRRSTIWTVSNGNFIFSAIVSLNKHSMTNSTKYLTFLLYKNDFHLSRYLILGNPQVKTELDVMQACCHAISWQFSS